MDKTIPLFIGEFMKDVQVAITDYYASKPNSMDPQVTIRPSVESLPETGNQEGDTRFQISDNKYYIFDDNKWNELDTGGDTFTGDVEFASDSELLEALKEGEELARG